jgi:hypothetical protein
MRYRLGILLGEALKGAAKAAGVLAVVAPVVYIVTKPDGFARGKIDA